jgi:hypothetical protein
MAKYDGRREREGNAEAAEGGEGGESAEREQRREFSALASSALSALRVFSLKRGDPLSSFGEALADAGLDAALGWLVVAAAT